MKQKTEDKVQHTYALRSIENVRNQHRLPNFSTLKYPLVMLHDIRPLIGTQFLNLNDHCILEVMEFLALTDLCTMAEVSVRLKQLAEFLFRLKHRHLDIKLLMHENNKICMSTARCLFRNFGYLMTSLHVSRKLFAFDLPSNDSFKGQQKLLFLINKFCNLNTLTMGHFWFNPDLIVKSIPLFTRLQTLNYYKLSCYCPEDKMFHHFGNVLSIILSFKEVAHLTPQLVQLV